MNLKVLIKKELNYSFDMIKKLFIFIFLFFYSSPSIALTKYDFSNNQLLCQTILWGFEFISSNKVKVINTDLNNITSIDEYYYDVDLELSYINIFTNENNIRDRIRDNTELLFNLFGCNVYGRADFILDNSGKPFFLEMNTFPGMTSTSLVPKSANANGVSFEELIRTIIMLSI